LRNEFYHGDIGKSTIGNELHSRPTTGDGRPGL
jgi:hypothetical protein